MIHTNLHPYNGVIVVLFITALNELLLLYFNFSSGSGDFAMLFSSSSSTVFYYIT